MLKNIKAEKKIYYIITTLLGVALLGIPLARYVVYFLPVIVIFIALLFRCLTFNFNRVVAPFILIILVSLPTAYEYDINSIKKLLFVTAYSSIFLFIDFSKVKINFHYYGAVLFTVLLWEVGISYLGMHEQVIKYSIIDSKSIFESTLAFPFAMLCSYYILQSRWLLSFVHFIMVAITLKRIALIAILITLLSRLVPRKVRNIIFSPYIITSLSIILTSITIYFAYGGLDDQVSEIFNRSANELSQGRQLLWNRALTGVDYEFMDYLFYGSGVGNVATVLEDHYGGSRILLHNDILVILIEYGFIILIFFLFLLLNQKTFEQKVMALALLTLLFTDNVIIYQHVMITYFFIQSQFTRENYMKRLHNKQHKPASVK
ncbi:MAG: hypothetical protein KZQ90_16410 [Candidatus Thiodiazotropha sp. (ex Codakia rugifera)]|nr:hypothetical protein [Candidatus Thiodiazotropha sp. (ex Codakia rugifera)]